jgi:hypothetical protein
MIDCDDLTLQRAPFSAWRKSPVADSFGRCLAFAAV